MRRWIEQFLLFARWERNAVIVLLLLCAAVFVAPRIYCHYKPVTILTGANDSLQIAEFKNQPVQQSTTDTNGFKQDSSSAAKGIAKHGGQDGLFYFNPNTIGKDGWVKLGLSEKQAESIEKYKAKGGRFYKAEDMKKLYVLDEYNYNRLLPYVKPDGYDEGGEKFASTLPAFDINTADSAAFEGLPGIGPAISHRIIVYRGKLGGFVSIQQLKEVNGISDEVFAMIKKGVKLENKTVHKIDINAAEVEEFKIHPYLHAALAKAICKYRSKHGDFSTVQDIKNVPGITDSIYRKIAPYLKTD